jgi:hypothetical protein
MQTPLPRHTNLKILDRLSFFWSLILFQLKIHFHTAITLPNSHAITRPIKVRPTTHIAISLDHSLNSLTIILNP